MRSQFVTAKLKIYIIEKEKMKDKMNKLIVKDDERIENLIYEIRDKQVVLDSDLARLYGCVNDQK